MSHKKKCETMEVAQGFTKWRRRGVMGKTHYLEKSHCRQGEKELGSARGKQRAVALH